MSLALRNLLFTVVVPGTGGVYVPWLILTRHGASPTPVAWPAAAVIAIGVGLYLWCLWVFAVVGRGTPGPWDPPRRLVAVGPYRRVRNPTYLAGMLIVLGEAWLLYAVVVAVAFHLLVIPTRNRGCAPSSASSTRPTGARSPAGSRARRARASAVCSGGDLWSVTSIGRDPSEQ